MPETSIFTTTCFSHFPIRGFVSFIFSFFFFHFVSISFFKLSNNFFPMLHLSNQFSFFLGHQVRVRAQHKEEIHRFELNQRLKAIASQVGVGEARADARA